MKTFGLQELSKVERVGRAGEAAKPRAILQPEGCAPLAVASTCRVRFGLAVAFFAAFLSGVFTAQAFVTYVDEAGNVARWNLVTPNTHTNVVNPRTKAIRYFVASEAYSAANRTAELNAVRACFAQWQSVPGTLLKFEEGGLAGPGVEINTFDNTNVVFWSKTASFLVNGERDFFGGRYGYTVVAYAADNTIMEADIVLNGADYTWFTDFNNTANMALFVEAVLLHEIGHLIGLDHSPVGGATVTAGGPGIGTESGLSSDEIADVKYLYPQPAVPGTLGTLRGQMTKNGAAVFGAMVIAEDLAGNVIAGTVSRADGRYELPALPPGQYNVRSSPLDPAGASPSSSLLRGRDIALDLYYDPADTAFLPTTNKPVSLAAGVTTTLNLAVAAGNPPFRITAISRPSPFAEAPTADRYAAAMRLGQSNFFVGVSSASLPASGATLTVTGDGLTLGQPIFQPNRFAGGLNLILIPISVSSNATPGLRSFVVQQGNNLAYANGYLEILPPIPDFNFDGLNDYFQRQHFPLFTAPEAAPDADPDGDGFKNRYEYRTGSDPANAQSVFFKIESVKLTAEGSTITWQSDTGKRYQASSRPNIANSPWEPVGLPATATGSITEFLDRSATNEMRFYRVEALP